MIERIDRPSTSTPSIATASDALQACEHVLDQRVAADQQFAQFMPLRKPAGKNLRRVNQPIVELRRIVGPVSAAKSMLKSNSAASRVRIDHAVRQLALNRRVLIVGRHFVEHERHVRAGDRHLDDHRRRRVIEERQAGPRLDHPPALELHDVRRRRHFQVLDSKHGSS